VRGCATRKRTLAKHITLLADGNPLLPSQLDQNIQPQRQGFLKVAERALTLPSPKGRGEASSPKGRRVGDEGEPICHADIRL